MTQLLHRNAPPLSRTPRLGFLGVGWIGRHRMQSIHESGAGVVAAVADPCREVLAGIAEHAPGAARCGSLDELLERDLDGVVIATPSALHAPQAIAALDRGLAVFCQKPLARTATEARAVVEAAQRADRLLGVDLSYRYTAAFKAVSNLIRAGELGRLYAADLFFHNAYGPDKPWFRDPTLSGGGCVIDLGIHLVDLALIALGRPRIEHVSSHLFAGGQPLSAAPDRVEDYAVATLRTADGASIRLACSWNLHAGQDAVIAADFYGDRGGASIRNVGGSFFDFAAEHFTGTSRRTLAAPPDEWGGRAAVAWAEQLARGGRFDPAAWEVVEAQSAIDRIYGREGPSHGRAP